MSLAIVKFEPCVIAFAGPPLVGKSTLGRELSKKTNFEFFDVDDARWQIFPRTERLPDFREDLAMLSSYTFNHFQAAESLIKGIPVAVGATYSREIYILVLRMLADSAGVPLRIFVLEAPENVIEERIRKRTTEGNPSVVNTIEFAREVRQRFRPIAGSEVTPIDTGLSIAKNMEQIMNILEPLSRKV